MGNESLPVDTILEGLKMTTTFICIIISAIAIEVDKFTQFQHRGLPLVAFAGVLTAIVTFVL